MNIYQFDIKKVEERLEYALRNSKLFNQTNLENIMNRISYNTANICQINYKEDILKFSCNNNLYLYKVNNKLLFFFNNDIYYLIEDINMFKIHYYKHEELLNEYYELKRDYEIECSINNYSDEAYYYKMDMLEDKYESIFEAFAKSLNIDDLKISIINKDETFYEVGINDIKLTQLGLFKKAGRIISTKKELLSNCKYFSMKTDFNVTTLNDISYTEEIVKNDCFYEFYNDKMNIIFSIFNDFDKETVKNLYNNFYFDDNVLRKIVIHKSNVQNDNTFEEYALKTKIEIEEIPF